MPQNNGKRRQPKVTASINFRVDISEHEDYQLVNDTAGTSHHELWKLGLIEKGKQLRLKNLNTKEV